MDLLGPKQDEHAAHEEARYYCPMHPQIRSPEPGECPICHMNLEPIPEERRNAPATSSAQAASPSAPSPSNVTPVTVSEEKQRAVGLATSVVESSTVGDRLRVPGVISAPETGLAQVRVRAPGFVEQVAVRQTGVRVTRGQPLAFIYSPEIYRAQEEFLAATRWTGAGSGGVAPRQRGSRHHRRRATRARAPRASARPTSTRSLGPGNRSARRGTSPSIRIRDAVQRSAWLSRRA
jgi:hypothetical protein